MRDEKIKVLIFSDRLQQQAKTLAEYLNRAEGIDVIGVAENRQQALNIARGCSFDYLIIVGYLKSEYNYSVISELQEQQKKFLPVQWAILDGLIFTFCHRYNIQLKFERTLPMADFVSYLWYNKEKPRLGFY
jgi:hypothetical protein